MENRFRSMRWLIHGGLFCLLLGGCRSRAAHLEQVAAIEHEHWMAWSKSLASEVSPERRARWEKYWVPYRDLPEAMKELDREWARKVLNEIEK